VSSNLLTTKGSWLLGEDFQASLHTSDASTRCTATVMDELQVVISKLHVELDVEDVVVNECVSSHECRMHIDQTHAHPQRPSFVHSPRGRPLTLMNTSG